MGLTKILLEHAKTKADFFAMISREQQRKNPVESFVLLTENEKVLNAYNRMVNSIYRTRNHSRNINRGR